MHNSRFLKQNRRQREIKKNKRKTKVRNFFRTSGGTGLPAIAFDKTRDRINFGVFLARIFDVTSAFDCVWIPKVAAAAHELANMMMRFDGSSAFFWGKVFWFLLLLERAFSLSLVFACVNKKSLLFSNFYPSERYSPPNPTPLKYYHRTQRFQDSYKLRTIVAKRWWQWLLRRRLLCRLCQRRWKSNNNKRKRKI